MARCTRYNIVWKIHQRLATGRWYCPGTTVSSTKKGPQRYGWNIVESDIKHQDPDLNRMFDAFQFFAMNVPDESFPETRHAH
jgi:hypothetical protein